MKFVGALILSFALLFSPNTRAEKMSVETTDIVIAKLERALPLVKDQSVKYVSLLLRLGDLYSERGRKKALSEYEQKCDTCQGSRSDRLKAIDYYKLAFPQTDSKHKGTVLFQMAHLHRLVGQPEKASQLFFQIVKGVGGPYRGALLASAHVGVGEVYYSKSQFEKALYHFNQALRYKSLKRRPFVIYRKAWSLLNVGQHRKAKATLVSLLKNSQSVNDESFQSDVSRDLSTFMARGSVTRGELDQLINLSPERSRRDNIFFLGGELARLGKKKSALMVFDYFLNSEKPSVREKLEISVHVAQLNYDLGQKALAASYLDQALIQWERKGCNEKTECEALRIKLRNFITHWNKDEKAKPSLALLKAYEAYIKRFPNDQKMVYWTAITAQKLKRYKKATKYFRASAQLKKGGVGQSSLYGEIEAAELSKQPALKLSAYNFYLAQNPQGKKINHVKYQRAYVYYEQKKYQQAAQEFRAIALDRKAPRSLRKKSADLVIDSLALVKDDAKIEIWAIELAKALPERKIEYLRTSRQASLKMAQKALSSRKSSKKDLNGQITKLRKLPYFGAKSKEVKVIFGTRLALAERAGNLGEIVAATKALLRQKGLSSSQIEDYRSRQAWAEEMRLNFKEAYGLTKKLKMSRLNRSNRHLKLAMLAQLAGKNETPHLKAFIKATPSRRKANQARAQLIRSSKAPWKELKNQLKVLKYTPDILASLTLDTYAKYENRRGLEKVLAIGRIRNTQEGTLLSRQLFLKEYNVKLSRAKHQKIKSSSPYWLKRSLAQRINNLGELEASVKVAVSRKDWVMQLITLSELKGEYSRTIDGILRIPFPKGLTKKQQVQYEKGLKQQVLPYRKRVVELDRKIDEFWSNKKALKVLTSRYRQANRFHRKLLKPEMNHLHKLAPTFKRWDISRALGSRGPEPKGSEVRAAWKDLKGSPFSEKYIRNLRAIEQRRGADTTVAYLDLRMTQVKKFRGYK